MRFLYKCLEKLFTKILLNEIRVKFIKLIDLWMTVRAKMYLILPTKQIIKMNYNLVLVIIIVLKNFSVIEKKIQTNVLREPNNRSQIL